MATPFHPQDQVRNAQFGAIYNWAQSIGKDKTSSYFIARSKVLKQHPIKKGEPLYP